MATIVLAITVLLISVGAVAISVIRAGWGNAFWPAAQTSAVRGMSRVLELTGWPKLELLIPDAKACGSPPSFPRGTADEIMAGRLTIAPFRTIMVDPRRDDIDWPMNPYHDPAWALDFRVRRILKTWLADAADAPAINQKRKMVMCAVEVFPGRDWIQGAIPALHDFYAARWQGAYNHVRIGDTYDVIPRDRPGTPLPYVVTIVRAGTPPKQRIEVYAAGYMFGRSGWGTARTFGMMPFYPLRFGPGTQIYGHADHMGLIYYARGRNLIAGSGHDSYASIAYRACLLPSEADKRTPAAVVIMSRSGGWYVLRIQIGSVVRNLLVSIGGDIRHS
jgi:hypothetical protein